MGKDLKKFRCINCGKTFEMSATAEDPIRCPYCGMGPGVLMRIFDDKAVSYTHLTLPTTERV